MTLASTICDLSREHCRAGGLIMGQNLEAVQNVCGTVPVDEPGVIIMPTCEAAGIGMAIGAALSGRPVIHVIRFASFLWLQASPIVYYAARAKSIWGYDLPLFIRVSSDDGIGPTHSGTYHSPFIHMPGLKVVAPMTPWEYEKVWKDFQTTRQPVLVSEHRESYAKSSNMPFVFAAGALARVTIIAVSAARFAAEEAVGSLMEKCPAEMINIFDLTAPLPDDVFEMCNRTRRVLVVGSEFEKCGILEHIAFQIQSRRELLEGNWRKDEPVEVRILGMKNPPGVNKKGSPSAADIAEAIINFVSEGERS